MRKNIGLSLPFLLASVVGASVAVSGFVSGCGTNPPLSLDSGMPDLSMTSSGADMATAPDLATTASTIQGNKLVGGTFTLIGYAGEKSIIAYDQTKKAVVAIDTASGTATKIDATIDTPLIHSGVVFTYDGVDNTSNVGAVNAWTPSGGQKALGTGTARYGLVAASDDSAYVFYSDNANTNGTQSDLYVAKVDGTSQFKISTSQTDTSCFPEGRFVGGKLFVRSCNLVGDAGAAGATALVVDPATGKVTTVATNIADLPFHINAAGTKLFAADLTTNAAFVVDISGASPSTKAIDTGVKDGWILPDDMNVIYVTAAGALRRAAISASPAPTTLLAMNAQALAYQSVGNEVGPALSPDGKYVVVQNNRDAMAGNADLYLASTTAAATPTMLATTTGYVFGDAFTQDGSRVLYYTSTINISAINGLVGTFNSMPVTGGTAVAHGKSSWVAYALQGSKVVYDTGDTGLNAKKPHGRGDLFWTDSAKTDAPTLIAPLAEADFYVNPAHTKVAFAIAGVAAAGVYLYTIP